MKKHILLFSSHALVLLLRGFGPVVICSLIVFSCHKKDLGGAPPPPSGNTASADSLSARLLFSGATKKQGTSPRGAAGSSLKISFEDTLYLSDELLRPIKFLHLDTTQHVAGVFMQVQAVVNGVLVDAHDYYDVPEIGQADSSDTTSVILVGIDPTDLKPPLTFNVIITPYNSNGQPIVTAVKPVKITGHETDAGGKSGCGLVLPDDEFWEWDATFVRNTNNESSLTYPGEVFGAGGQNIGGHCCGGTSIYPFNCPGDTTGRVGLQFLHFATFHRIVSETLRFQNDGTFLRQTIQDGEDPIADSSDFCAGGEGRTRYHLNQTVYTGTYSVSRATLPQALQRWENTDSLQVRLNTTTTTPPLGGFGNGGGIIHQLDCNVGALVLIQVDLEGFGQHLFRFYSRRSHNKADRWFAF